MEIPINKDFEDFLYFFNKNKVEYVIIGGYAVMFYCEPIFTKDLDIYINSSEENAKNVYESIKEFFGVDIKGIAEEDFSKLGFVYQIGIAPNRIDIINSIAGVDFSSAWNNRNKALYGKETMWILDRESLIKNKRLLKRKQDILHLLKLEEHQRG
ncbi:MAG: hypothetical protein AB1595_04135 [bacterium]